MTADIETLPDTLFEISWEVCNKVGGIHTVLRSKAPFLSRAYAQKRYLLIGPWNAIDGGEFSPRPEPEFLRETFAAVRARGIPCAYGVWFGVPGEPSVILVDFRGLFAGVNALKHGLWERYGIDSLGARYDFDEPLCFATAAGTLVDEYARRSGDRTVAHCHEWMTGFAILHLRAINARVGTVFTTHATMLGRTIAGNGHDLYKLIADPSFDARAWAYRLNVQEKHLTEVACAATADVFTTVSDITSQEAVRILGKGADRVTRNGYHIDRVPSFSETAARHEASRDLLQSLCAALWAPVDPFDPEEMLLLVTSGRYEMRNKGIDALIAALGRVNERLRQDGSHKTIALLCFVIRDRGTVKREILERWSAFARARSRVESLAPRILQRVAVDLISGRSPTGEHALTRAILDGLAPSRGPESVPRRGSILTHDVTDEASDPILRACAAAGLRNGADDRVKILFLPGMLDGTDGLLNVTYEDLLAGAHLGVFPSAYEPWGYTPLESAMLGVPTITTDAAGFGAHAKPLSIEGGVFVLDRLGLNDEAFTARLAQTLEWFANLDRSERIRLGVMAKRIAETCDWNAFISEYLRAYDDACRARRV